MRPLVGRADAGRCRCTAGAGARRAIALVVLALFAVAPPSSVGAPRAAPAAKPAPRNLILLIADGCGPASFGLARAVAGRPLALDPLLIGAAETAATDSRITDSAASATALATGTATRKRAIAVDSIGRAVGTLLEAAEARGMATGIAVTSRVTHATPACFSAHVAYRDDEDSIAVQQLAQGIEVLLGGGRRRFQPDSLGGSRRDGRDLLAAARERGVRVVTRPDELRRVERPPVLGLFAADHMSYELDRDPEREPSLAAMTRRAIELLEADPDGFVLVVEGSRPDNAAHENDAATLAREVLAFDEAVAVALEFARRDGRTLVVATADHETGGLTLGRERDDAPGWRPEVLRGVRRSAVGMADRVRAGAPPDSVLAADAGITDLEPAERDSLRAAAERPGLAQALLAPIDRRARVGWTTEDHTAADVNVYASGPGELAFRGTRRNDALGRALASVMRLDLDAVTRRLRAPGAALGTPPDRPAGRGR